MTDFVPEKSKIHFETLINKMEDTCMSPFDIYRVVQIISTNQYVYNYLENPDNYSTTELKTNIFKEVRSNLDNDVFIKIGPIIHVLIIQYLKNIKPNSNIHKLLKKRHELISHHAMTIKSEQPEICDIDAWLIAEQKYI